MVAGTGSVRPVKVTPILVIALVKPLTATVWVTVALSTNVMPVELVKLAWLFPQDALLRRAAADLVERVVRALPVASSVSLCRGQQTAFRQRSAAAWLVILPAVGHRLAVPTAVQHPRTLADRSVCGSGSGMRNRCKRAPGQTQTADGCVGIEQRGALAQLSGLERGRLRGIANSTNAGIASPGWL